MSFNEHGIFRLGDIVGSGLKQHWEILEDKGFSVAALSPINASNNTKNSTFWIPDPWVNTNISGNSFVRRLAKTLQQTVNDNSQKKLSLSSMLTIIEGLITKSQIRSWPTYFSCLIGAFKNQHWSRAIFLDRLLADIFINLWKKNKPDFSVIFLNSGAHIQHHYLCSSKSYNGPVKNPDWYISSENDPLLEILEMYDKILKDLRNLKDIRLMIAVGLRQVPFENAVFYWRLKDHDGFLKKIGINFKKTTPRMTRDFLIEFENNYDLVEAEKSLKKVRTINGDLIFREVDNRGNDLFVSLTYSHDIQDDFSIFLDETEFKDFKKDVSFVAIKNGHHDSLGYYLDSSRKPFEGNANIPIKNIFMYVMNHFGI